MNLTPIVNQLRAYAPSFGKRVASAADYDPQAAASTSMKRPCAYVVFDGLELEESPNSQKVRQVIRESFSVFVEIDMGKGDERGAALVPEIHRLRKEIFRSLIGFRPDDECDPIQAKSVQIDSFNRSVAIVVFEFFTEYMVGRYVKGQDPETWQEAEIAGLKPFDGMDVDVDVIDPIADPNLKKPGPDGRVEFQFSVETNDENASSQTPKRPDRSRSRPQG